MTNQKYWILAGLMALVVILNTVSFGLRNQSLSILGATPSHVGPDRLYPDPKFTKGKVETSSFVDLIKSYNGQTYSQAHRAVSSSEKKTICAEYVHNCGEKVEIDHFIPLAIGGSNDTTNLWAQPEVNDWNGQDFGFHTKDKLETFLVAKVKKGEVAPKVAQDCIASDWVYCYQKYIGNNLGGTEGIWYDGEDDVTNYTNMVK